MQQLYTLEGDKSNGCGRNASVHHVYPVSRTTGEERGGGVFEGGGGQGEGGFLPALDRIDVYLVGTYYTHGARSRRWCGW